MQLNAQGWHYLLASHSSRLIQLRCRALKTRSSPARTTLCNNAIVPPLTVKPSEIQRRGNGELTRTMIENYPDNPSIAILWPQLDYVSFTGLYKMPHPCTDLVCRPNVLSHRLFAEEHSSLASHRVCPSLTQASGAKQKNDFDEVIIE